MGHNYRSYRNVWEVDQALHDLWEQGERISREEFLSVCKTIGYQIHEENGRLFFVTEESYPQAIHHIQDLLHDPYAYYSDPEPAPPEPSLAPLPSENPPKKETDNGLIFVLVFLGVLVLGACIVLIFTLKDRTGSSSRKGSGQSSTTVSRTVSTTSSETIQPNTEPPWTTSPVTEPAPTTEAETRNEYISHDTEEEQGELRLVIHKAWYENGSLVTDVYLINGTNQNIRNISLDAATVKSDGQTIADADFSGQSIHLDGSGLTSGGRCTVTLTFPADTVSINDFQLSDAGELSLETTNVSWN